MAFKAQRAGVCLPNEDWSDEDTLAQLRCLAIARYYAECSAKGPKMRVLPPFGAKGALLT
jgi:hypothetical protein